MVRIIFSARKRQSYLAAAAPSAAGCRNTLAITTDEFGRDWPHRVEQVNFDEIQPVVLSVRDALRGKRAFNVRLDMENNADRNALPGNRIDRLRIECVHQSPPPGATAKLVEDDYGNLSYEDDSATTRWRHLGQVKVAHKNYGGHRGDEFGIGMVGGYATSTELLQRFSSPRPLKKLVVTADCYADGKNLGGQVVLQVAPRGAKPWWQVATQNLHRGPLQIEVSPSELGDLQEFDVRVVVRSSSGVEHGTKSCAALRALKVEGR